MSQMNVKKPANDQTRLGEYAATQPVSGVAQVIETFAVSGHGRGAFVRTEEAEKTNNAK